MDNSASRVPLNLHHPPFTSSLVLRLYVVFLLLSALLQLHQCWEKRENRMGQGACPCPMRGTINQSFSISQTNPYSAEVSAAAGVSVGSAADTLAVPVLEYLVKSMCITTTTVSVAWKPIELSKSIVTVTGTA